jgi:hypothetical protein
MPQGSRGTTPAPGLRFGLVRGSTRTAALAGPVPNSLVVLSEESRNFARARSRMDLILACSIVPRLKRATDLAVTNDLSDLPDCRGWAEYRFTQAAPTGTSIARFRAKDYADRELCFDVSEPKV